MVLLYSQIKNVNISHSGKTIQAISFSIKPYITDPLRNTPGRAKYKKLSKKKYTFVLSKEIPGEIFSITTSVRGKDKKPPLIEESIKFVEM